MERARLRSGDVVLVDLPDPRHVQQALNRVGPEGEGVMLIPAQFPRVLEQLETRLHEARMWYLLGDFEVIPLPDASVNSVISETGSWLDLDRDSAQECFRVLRPEGGLAITGSLRAGDEPDEYLRFCYLLGWQLPDEDEVVGWLTTAGFERIELSVVRKTWKPGEFHIESLLNRQLDEAGATEDNEEILTLARKLDAFGDRALTSAAFVVTAEKP